MFGAGEQVGANVVLTSDNSGYDSSMQQSVAQTHRLADAYDSLRAKIDRGFATAQKVSFGIAAADIASVTAMTAVAARYGDQMRGLKAQSDVLNRSYGDGQQRMKDYGRAVDDVRGKFGDATRGAAQLIQTISGFERAGSTRGLSSLADNFERMSQTTGESATALAQSVLTLEQTMGTGLRQTKAYSDQLVSMSMASNTSATSLANFASQIAPLGRQLNMTQSEITGFAAAFSKAGQDGYRASNVFSQMTSDIAQSLQTNSPRLAAYAQLLGVTSQALKGMSGANITAGLFDAIGRQGSNSLHTLNELGYDGLNVTRVVSAVAQQSGGVGNYIRMANGTYGNGSAGLGQQTVGQQFSKLRQDIEMDSEAIGSKFVPALKMTMTFIDKIAADVTSFMQGPGGDLVATFAALLAPVAALAGGLLSLHGAILPLMTLMAIKRTGVGTGVVNGLMGRPMTESMAALDASGERRLLVGGYRAGAAVGGFAGRAVSNPRMRWVLGMDKLAAAERGGAVSEALAAGTITPGGRFGRFMNEHAVKPQFEPLYEPDSAKRSRFFGGFGGGSGRLGATETEAASATEGFRASVTRATVSVREWAAGLIKGGVDVAASEDAAAKSYADSAATVTSASAKLDEALVASSAAVETNAAAQTDAAVTIGVAMKEMMAQAGMGAMGMLRGAGSGLAFGAGVAGRGALAGAATLGEALGPVGGILLASMFAPTVLRKTGFLDYNTTGSIGSASTVSGTGLNSQVPGVVAPVQPSGGAGYNPLSMTPAQLYAAGQNADFTNKGVANLTSAEQAAAIYGPVFGQMAAGEQQSLMNDIAKKLGPGGYRQFVSKLQSGKYSSYGAGSANVASGANGGLSMLYSIQSQIGQGYTNQAGSDFQALMGTFLSAPGSTYSRSPGGKRQFLHDDFNLGGSLGGAQGRGLAIKTDSGDHLGGILPWGNKTSYSLTGPGQDFLKQLFGTDPSKSDSSSVAKMLYGMPQNLSPQDQMKYLLSHLSRDQLSQTMSAHALAPTGTQSTDVATVLKAIGSPRKPLASALAGLGLSDKEGNELQNLDSSNPLYYAMRLFSGGGQTINAMTGMQTGISQRRLAQLALQAGSIIPQTISSVQAYGSQQLQIQSPFLSPAQQLFGSTSGRPGVSGMNAGMFATPLGGFNGQFSLLGSAQGQFQIAKGLQARGDLSGNTEALQGLQTSATSLEQAYTQQLQAMKQYSMTLEQMNFSSQQFKQSMAWQAEEERKQVGREKSDESRNVRREEYQFSLQRRRAEVDFDRQRFRAEQDYNTQRNRAMADFTHQTTMMIKQSALSMHDIFTQDQPQGFTSAQFLLTNNAQQTASMNRQENQLATLRRLGLSTDSIQQMSLGDSKNAQELNGLFQQLSQNPALIDQLNAAVKQRLTAAGGLATDASSMTYQEQVHQFQLSLDRGAMDFARSMKRAGNDFDLQMHRSAVDFNRQMAIQDSDFHRQLARQASDYNTAVAHSWTSFNQQVSESMKQMNIAAGSLDNTMGDIGPLVKAFGRDSNIGKNALALQNAQPAINKLIGGINNLLNPKVATSGKNEPFFMKLLDILTGHGSPSGGGGLVPSGSPLLGGAGGGLPPDIATRMRASHPTAGMCLQDVENVLATPHYGAGGTAYRQWLKERGHRHSYSMFMPVGAPLFYGPEHGGGAGHVAIYGGGGMMWSEDTGKWVKKPIWPHPLGWSDDLNGKRVAGGGYGRGFASGAWNLHKDMFAQIHAGEMIIPAKIAHVVRQAVSKGQAANLHTTSQPVYSHVDARSYSTTNSTTYTGDIINQGVQNPAEFSAAMKQQARLAALAKR